MWKFLSLFRSRNFADTSQNKHPFLASLEFASFHKSDFCLLKHKLIVRYVCGIWWKKPLAIHMNEHFFGSALGY